MAVKLIRHLRQVRNAFRHLAKQSRGAEDQMLLTGKLLSEIVRGKKEIRALGDVEFRIFSQFGDDGIIQWLVNNIQFPNRTFIEFGVEDYTESNTRFLMMNDNWSGFVMDGSKENIARIVDSAYFWKHELAAKAVFVDRENINGLIASRSFDKDVGILHIDLDGNDYWIWEAVNVITPVVVILEYNSVFGADRAITVPYDRAFGRIAAHSSGLYYGASLRALCQLSAKKGYSFIGSNSAGNNAYFVRNEKLNDAVRVTPLENGFVISRFRESRDGKGVLTFVTGKDRIEVIRGMPVYNVDTDRIEPL